MKADHHPIERHRLSREIVPMSWTARTYAPRAVSDMRLLAPEGALPYAAIVVRYGPHTHHRRSIRLASWDYGNAGAYFVTICTFTRECILDDDHLRGVVERAWAAIVNPCADTADGDLVVMPNHVHGIVWIPDKTPVGARHQTDGREPKRIETNRDEFANHVSSGASPLRPFRAPAPGSLGTILGSFKSNTARRINNIRQTPGAPVWQRNYYEHIIRSDEELLRIRRYILDNPRLGPRTRTTPAHLDPRAV